jgi:hypothetical protein
MIRLALGFCLLAVTALAADVDPSLCRDIDDTTRALVPIELHPWYKVPHGVKACPAYSRKHQLLWWIFGIDEDAVSEDWWHDPALYPLHPGGFTRRRSPKPYLVDSKGRELGRLSDSFPTHGAPSHTDLLFSQWIDDFPRRITIKVFNAWALGDYVAPPLQWNVTTQYYDQIGKGLFDMPPARKQP